MEARKCDICGEVGVVPFNGWFVIEPAVTNYVTLGSFVRTDACGVDCLAKAVATLQTSANEHVGV